MGIPQLVIGLTIVAMGTSAPEAAVSINASLKGNAGIAIGNVVGSNILNIFIILGISAVLATIAIQKSTFRYEIPFMIIITVVLILLGMTGEYVTRVEGIIAVLAGVFLWISVAKTKSLRKPWGIVFLLCYAAYLAYLMML